MARKLRILLTFSVFASQSALFTRAQSSGAPPADKQQQSPATSPQQAPLPDEGNIPEEDETEHKETEYHFNPIRAQRELSVGTYYWKKGSYRAAASRFLEATRWNPNWAEAYLKLGEAEAKLKHTDDARKALSKVVEIDPKSKEAKEAKKLTAKL